MIQQCTWFIKDDVGVEDKDIRYFIHNERDSDCERRLAFNTRNTNKVHSRLLEYKVWLNRKRPITAVSFSFED